MADTRAQNRIEEWIVDVELPRLVGQEFSKKKVPLSWGGSFEVDATSTDGRIVACVSTSQHRTAGGRAGIGKIQKIRSDALFLLHIAGAKRRLLIFTDPDMYRHFSQEQQHGRFPPSGDVELLIVQLPDDLSATLDAARLTASQEVSPRDGQPSRRKRGKRPAQLR